MKTIAPAARVVVLGGAGEMGRAALQVAASWGSIGQLVIADLNGEAAARLAEEVTPAGSTTVAAAAVDVTDADAMAELLAGTDVVLNTTGPFTRLGLGVLRTVLDAGCHYLDICDDWEPTVPMLDLHDLAAAQGLVAVIGMGASPGLTNLLAAMAADDLDEVEDLYTAWPVDVAVGDTPIDADLEAGDGAPSAAVLHWMLQLSGSIDVIDAGRQVAVEPLEPVAIEFPGVGSGTAYTVGHPEPITLPPRLGVTGRCRNLMVMSAGVAAFLEGLRRDIDAGRMTIEQAAIALQDEPLARTARAALRGLWMKGAGGLPGFFALATGLRHGRSATVGMRALTLPPSMARATGAPLALGLQQLLEGRIDAVGVHPPEAVVDPELLFGALAPYCQPSAAGIDDVVARTLRTGSAT